MSKRLNLTILSIIICILSFVMILATTSTLKVGSGFGRETKFVIKTQNNEVLADYLDNLERKGIETEFKEISDYEFEVTFSALENVDLIKSELSKIIPDVNFSYEGSFGNLATYINNQGFLRTYLLLLIFSVFIYFSSRYRFWGFIIGMQITLAFSIGLLFVILFNLSFSETLWYAIIVMLLMTSMSKHSVIKNNINISGEDMVKGSYQLIKRPLYVGILNLLFGLLILKTSLLNGESLGLFIIAFSLIMIFSDLLLAYYLPKIIEIFSDETDTVEFVDRWSVPSRLGSQVLFKRISLTALLVLLVLLVLAPKLSFNEFRGRDYDSQKVLIVSDSNAKSYLEVEAMLNSIGLFDKQLSYSTSDSNQLWIYFDREVSESDLKIARNIITNSLEIDVSYYVSREVPFPTQHIEFYLSLIVSLILAGATIWLLAGKGASLKISVLSLISIVVFSVLIFLFAPEVKKEYILLIYSIPIFFVNYYSSPRKIDNLNNIDNYITDFSLELMTLGIIVLILSGLVLIIVPIQMGVDLIKSFIIYAISIQCACLLYVHLSHLTRKYVKAHDDESY